MGLAFGKANERRRVLSVLTAALALFCAPLVAAPPASASTQGTASGAVFNDINGNGVHDLSDPGLVNRTVYVDINSDGDLDVGEPNAITTTGGIYSIDEVEAGSYPVRSVMPAGWVASTPSPPTNVIADNTVGGVEVGAFQLGSIAGTVFSDVNGNGLKNSGDNGVAGLTVYIDSNTNSIRDGGEPFTSTDGAGTFAFDALPSGSYAVRLTAPIGTVQTNNNPAAINVISGTAATAIDFGLFTSGSISGRVFQDVDASGTRDVGEPGFSSATVFFDLDADMVLDGGETSTTTDGSGAYFFPSLDGATYQVTVVLPVGYGATSAQVRPQLIASGTYASDVDFGVSNEGAIAGLVYEDSDSDATQDVGEPASPGKTVFLDTDNDGVNDVGELSAVTDGSGEYSFSGLVPGAYRPRLVVPAGTSQTTVSLATVNAPAGAPVSGVNFGLFTQGVISGTVFIDLDGDGEIDAGEGGASARVVYLDTNNNNSLTAGEQSRTTDSTGAFSFNNLAAGTYRPKLVMPAGTIQTSIVPSTINITSGVSAAGTDFGLFTLGSIQGTIHNDFDGDGTRDVGEPALGTRTVFLDNNDNGIADVGEPTAVSSASGLFNFPNLGPGGYRVRIVPPVNTIRTSPLLSTVTVTSGLTSTGNDIALFTLGTISGVVYNDTNANGVKVIAEPGLVGRTVFIDADSDDEFDAGELTAVTGTTGVYNFNGLTVGSYRVRALVPSGHHQTSTDPAAVSVTSGTTASLSFGLYLDSQITGTVFNDVNGNGSMGAGELGVDAVTAYIDVDNDNVHDVGEQSTITNSSGQYALTDLGPVLHRVKILSPAGRTQTSINPALVTPPSGGTTTNINFGLFIHASIAGSVFDDTDGNGLKATADPLVSGVTIFLDSDADGLFDVGEPNTVTDVNGNYEFLGLNTGSHRARMVAPASTLQTSANPAVITETSGLASTNVNFGVFYRAVISGVVFNDLDGDAALDSGENGVAGKTVFLDTNGNGAITIGEPTTVSDPAGNYSFTGLGVGTFTPRITVPGDSVLTTTSISSFVTQSGSTLSANPFGLFVKASLTGVVYNDLVGNGTKESGDAGVGSRTVYIDIDRDGVNDVGEPTASTSAAGLWTINNLAPGSYSIRVVVPSGVMQSSATIALFSPQSGSFNTNFDFGLFTYASITGTVFTDINGNSLKASPDVGVASRLVYIDVNANDNHDLGETSVLTNPSGVYLFSGLTAGTYRVRTVIPANAIQTNANPSVINASSATAATAIDFGVFALATLGGTVYDDTNSSGTRQGGESGRAAIDVYIDLNGNAAFDLGEPATVTSSSGDFAFGGLTAGNYRIRAVVPAGNLQTTTALATITTTSGMSSTTNLVGFFRYGSISGAVYHDQDGNGVMDVGEAGVAGRTVFLDSNGNGLQNPNEPTAATDTDGTYQFSGLPLAVYKVRLIVPTGVIQTTASPANLSVSSGSQFTNVSFGTFVGGSISGTVFNDTNLNGTKEGTEQASSGRSVYIDADNDGTKDPTERAFTSNSSGAYSFTGLMVGTYRLRIALTAPAVVTGPAPADIVVVSGTVVEDVDFGVRTSTTGGVTTTTTTIPGSPTTTIPSTAPTTAAPPPVPQDVISQNTGYYMTSSEGGVFAYGEAKFFGSAVPFKPNAPIVSISPTPTGAGYHQVATDGGIFAFGDAKFYGSMGGKPLNKPIVGMASTPTGLGYWLVATDGGIFAYGDAKFFGSTGSIKLNKPIVGMTPTPSGNGYWMVASDGGIFAYGDAKFYGSTGSMTLNKPIVGMAASGNDGYWLVASDGGIFAYGGAKFYGSMGGTPLNSPIVSIRAPLGGGGYWMFAADGGVFSFGSAKFKGGTPPTSSPIVN